MTTRWLCAVLLVVVYLSVLPLSAQSVCGNGAREAGEQCDDGNQYNLDGCSATCTFEQIHRANAMGYRFTTNAFCPANAFGGAFVSGPAQTSMNQSLTDGVNDGSVSIMFALRNLDDLSGVSDATVSVGLISGVPFNSPSATYDGANDLDWWYLADPTTIDGNRLPLTNLTASIAASVLTTQPGSVTLTLPAFGVPAMLSMSSFKLTAPIGSVSQPLSATSFDPPGHTSLEHLDAALTSFATTGAGLTGQTCGDIRAASLRNVSIPASLVGGGTFACSQGYTAANTMLDVIVGGCTVFFIQQIKATQPDKYDAAQPAAGAGAPYKLILSSSKTVTSCQDATAATVDLTTCLNAAAYSSSFAFSTDRVIVKPAVPTPIASNDGPYCSGATVNLTASGPDGTYAWTGPNGFSSALQNPSISNATTADAGTYSVTVTSGETSLPATTTVTINPVPNAAITAPSSVVAGSTGNTASVANAGAGASYTWSITNGSISAGAGTRSITFTAGAAGTLTLSITVNANGCADSKSANLTVTSVGPRFDPNGDGTITLADVFYLVNYLFAAGAAPQGPSGVLSGDANNDGVVGSADVVYLINYLFAAGPAPAAALFPQAR